MTSRRLLLLHLVALAASLLSGCWFESDCSGPPEDWLADAPLATRNTDGEPTVEIRGLRESGGCGAPGLSTLVEVGPSDLTIRELATGEELPGPLAESVGDGRRSYEDAGVTIELSWEPSFVSIEIDRGGSITSVECDSASPEGLPACVEL